MASQEHAICSSMLHLVSLIWHDAMEVLTQFVAAAQVARRSTVGGGHPACGRLVGAVHGHADLTARTDTAATCKQHAWHTT